MASDTIRKKSSGSKVSLKHGEEPTGLLLALVWSSVETLLERNEVEVYQGEGKVVLVFKGAEISPSVGLQIANTANTANTSPEVPTLENPPALSSANTANTSPEVPTLEKDPESA